MSVKNLILSAAVSLILASGATLAADPAPAKTLTPQQQKMGTCNKEATGKKGDERKAFMKTCLSGDSKPASTQQDKMKTCNADASTKAMKGDTRKAYMKTCLSGDAAATP